MKKCILICSLILFHLSLMAQQMHVKSLRLDENDLTANTAGTIVLDQNGQKCALIKFETSEKELSFSSSPSEVMKTIQKVGEVWVYVPEGVKRITVSHPDYGVINDYDLGLSTVRAKAYIIQIDVSSSSSEGYGAAAITSNPSKAELYIDGTKMGVTPQFIQKLQAGEHEFRISSQGYKDYVGRMNIREGEIAQQSIALESIYEKLTSVGQDARRVITVDSILFSMILVEGGTFMMGDATERDTIHPVTLSSYYIGETEVTQQLWKAIMGKKKYPSSHKNDKFPVSNISWDDCQDFIQKLNNKTGLKFRLPTEAEWEFAARGGNYSHGYKYSGSDNHSDVAWYLINEIHEVKKKKANELGLYDMNGNVFEWCQDCFEWYGSKSQKNPVCLVGKGAYECDRIIRGGCFMGRIQTTVTTRSYTNRTNKREWIGFRLVLEITDE